MSFGKKTLAIVSFCLLASGVFAEIKLLGGFSAGFFSERLETSDGKFFETKIPFTFLGEVDYFPKPDFWFGFSGKLGFSLNAFTAFGTQGETGWRRDFSLDESSTSFSLFVSPSAIFRKNFKNFQYLSGSVGFVYNFSYFNMPMVYKIGEVKYHEKVKNAKNSIGLNFEIFYRMSQTKVDHGLFVNVQWLFASGDTDIFGAKFRGVNAIDFSVGYKIGKTFFRKNEGMTAVYRDFEEKKKQAEREAFEKEEARKNAEKLSARKQESEAKSFQRKLLRMSRETSSPVIISAKSCNQCSSGGKNIRIEFQNVSKQSFDKIVFRVVPKDRKGRIVKVSQDLRNIEFSKNIEPDFSNYTFVKRNYWSDSKIEKFDIASMTIFDADGNVKVVRNVAGATLSDELYKQKLKVESR